MTDVDETGPRLDKWGFYTDTGVEHVSPENLPYAKDLKTILPYGESRLRSILGQAVGEASTCWEHLENTGIFDDVRARALVDRLNDAVLGTTGYGEPHLGCATNLQLIEELEARERMGHTAEDYRTATDS